MQKGRQIDWQSKEKRNSSSRPTGDLNIELKEKDFMTNILIRKNDKQNGWKMENFTENKNLLKSEG